MAGITLQQAEKQLQLWIKAEQEIAASQSYTIGGRSLTRANLKDVREQIKFWQNQVNQLSTRGRNRITRTVPRDL